MIALFKSFGSEVDTTELIEYSIIKGKIVALPKVVNNELKFYKIEHLKDTLIKSKLGVEEPIANEINYIVKDNINLVIVPGLCFNKVGDRLGYGKGYYDRFLTNTNFKTIAICFEEQILEKEILPVTYNDVKVQQVITDKEIINVKKM